MFSNVLTQYKNLLGLLLLFLFLVSPSGISAAILINEISPSTEVEWVELYNDGDSPVDLAGYLLEDGNTSKTDDLILSGIILSNGFLVFNHNEGWLNNSGDTIKLYNNASPSAIIDQYTYGSVDSTKSIARIPNGSENWQVTSIVTKGISNPSPTPSPSPTNSPTQQPQPTATAVPSPTKTSTPKTESPISKTSIPTSSPEVLGDMVLEDDVQDSFSNTPQATILSDLRTEKVKQNHILPIILVGFGVLLLSFSGYRLYLKLKSEYNN